MCGSALTFSREDLKGGNMKMLQWFTCFQEVSEALEHLHSGIKLPSACLSLPPLRRNYNGSILDGEQYHPLPMLGVYCPHRHKGSTKIVTISLVLIAPVTLERTLTKVKITAHCVCVHGQLRSLL